MPRRLTLGWLFAVVCLVACHRKPAIAELTKADGPVERQETSAPWKGAGVGAKFFIGDAARTADGGAALTLAGNAQIAMQPHTVLRFGGGKNDSAKISVELGAIDLSGGGNYGLDVGDVKLAQNGSVRITARGQGQSSIELTVGSAQIAMLDGKVQELEIGKVIDPGIGAIKVEAVKDAGVDAAPVDAGTDAAATDVAGDAHIEVTGKHAEVQGPTDTKWTPLPAGAGTITTGTKLRLGNGTSAKLVGNTTTLELSTGSRMTIGANLLFGLELGSGRASVPAATEGKVGVPGGSVELKGTAQGPAEAKLDVNAHGETKVTVTRGGATLNGGPGTTLPMNRGETASMRGGAIHPIEAIPTYFDMRVTVGETPNFTIHDPRGATALQFNFNGKCPNGGVIEMDHDNRFRTTKLSGGKDSANMLVPAGSWAYRLRCTVGDAEGSAVASGRVVVVRDDGRRPIPKEPGVNPIDADGRTYRISYQSMVPNIKIRYSGSASAYKLHIATGGVDETFESTTPSFNVPGNKLKEATYTYWVDHDGVQDKISTLIINFDQTAPQVYIELPLNGQPFGPDIQVKGAVLPLWTAKVDVVEIPIDPHTRRFTATVPPPEGAALAIRLSHPQRGVHFYLRRAK